MRLAGLADGCELREQLIDQFDRFQVVVHVRRAPAHDGGDPVAGYRLVGIVIGDILPDVHGKEAASVALFEKIANGRNGRRLRGADGRGELQDVMPAEYAEGLKVRDSGGSAEQTEPGPDRIGRPGLARVQCERRLLDIEHVAAESETLPQVVHAPPADHTKRDPWMADQTSKELAPLR